MNNVSISLDYVTTFLQTNEIIFGASGQYQASLLQTAEEDDLECSLYSHPVTINERLHKEQIGNMDIWGEHGSNSEI